MFSPAIRKPHLLHRRDREEASPSPPPAAPTHSPSPRGFVIPDRPATGTPAPWTSSSLLARYPSLLICFAFTKLHFAVWPYPIESRQKASAARASPISSSLARLVQPIEPYLLYFLQFSRISGSKRTERAGDSDQIQPVHVAEFPQVVRNAQASLLKKNFSGNYFNSIARVL
jgi:hypothetical protein